MKSFISRRFYEIFIIKLRKRSYKIATQLNEKFVSVPAVLKVFAVKPVADMLLIVMIPAVVPVTFAVTTGTPLKITGLKVTAKVPLLVVPVPYRVRLGAVVTPSIGSGRREARASTLFAVPNMMVPKRCCSQLIPSEL